ncbi:MAG TPA: PTS sugar transporter subunit IIA [Anaerolineae bacterium]|nr:PTS sugar transporter subunit IIA [Anaerolineae bacterium]
MIKILELLEPAATGFQLKAETSTEVIAYLGKLLVAAGYVRASFIDAAVSREKELPTGLPLNGSINAAIPHTDVEHVIKPGLAMATLAQPVIFQNMAVPDESVPVQLVFLLALDKPKAQIEMLQEIAGLLQQPDIVAGLTEANNFEEVKKLLVAS